MNSNTLLVTLYFSSPSLSPRERMFPIPQRIVLHTPEPRRKRGGLLWVNVLEFFTNMNARLYLESVASVENTQQKKEK